MRCSPRENTSHLCSDHNKFQPRFSCRSIAPSVDCICPRWCRECHSGRVDTRDSYKNLSRFQWQAQENCKVAKMTSSVTHLPALHLSHVRPTMFGRQSQFPLSMSQVRLPFITPSELQAQSTQPMSLSKPNVNGKHLSQFSPVTPLCCCCCCCE